MSDSRPNVSWSLIARAADGDRTARSVFGQSYLPVVQRFLRARWAGTPLLGEVDDGTQEVFVECLREGGVLSRADPTAVAVDPPVGERVGATIRRLESDLAEQPEHLAILRGERPARDAGQWGRAVRLAYYRSMHAEVVALTEGTLRDAPELLDHADKNGTYNPACCATLLAADPTTDGAERVRLRGLARSWLLRCAESSPGGLMKHALTDPDFASVRGEALESLPEAERAAWSTLWKKIEEAAK